VAALGGQCRRTFLRERHEGTLHKGQGSLVHGHAWDSPHQGQLHPSMLSLLPLCHVTCKKKKRKKKRKDYTFWHQFNEKPSSMTGCPRSFTDMQLLLLLSVTSGMT